MTRARKKTLLITFVTLVIVSTVSTGLVCLPAAYKLYCKNKYFKSLKKARIPVVFEKSVSCQLSVKYGIYIDTSQRWFTLDSDGYNPGDIPLVLSFPKYGIGASNLPEGVSDFLSRDEFLIGLQALDLSGRLVSDTHWTHIERIPGLRELDLGDTNVDTEHLSKLKS